MLLIFLERYGHFHLNRPRKYLDLDTQFVKHFRDLAIEVSDGHGLQRE